MEFGLSMELASPPGVSEAAPKSISRRIDEYLRRV